MTTCPKCKRGSWPVEGLPCPTPECGDVAGGRYWVVPRLPPPTAVYEPCPLPPVDSVAVIEDVYERTTWAHKGVRYYQWHKVS